jgi:hypothetical protein
VQIAAPKLLQEIALTVAATVKKSNDAHHFLMKSVTLWVNEAQIHNLLNFCSIKF